MTFDIVSWPMLVLALLVFGFAPGIVLRLIVLAFKRSDPRRQELLGELHAVPRFERPFWVAEQLEIALFEGLRDRLLGRRNHPARIPPSLKQRLDEALGQAPGDAMQVLLSFIADCDLRAYNTRRASERWGSAYYLLVLPAAVLATIAGAAGLASTAGRIPIAIVALAAAGLATAATFLNNNEHKQRNGKLSAAWQELADDVRLTVINYGRGKDTAAFKANRLLNDIIYFNKRKSALLRGDLSGSPSLSSEDTDS
jgi:hypothetical protein